MFTGLVEEVGTIESIDTRGEARQLVISALTIMEQMRTGDSISIDGVCLTVTAIANSSFHVEAVSETLSRSTLGDKKPGEHVNLERAMQASSRFGGHFVQGHVDGVGNVVAVNRLQTGVELSIRLPEHLLTYIVEKGSIAINGLSLTVAELENDVLKVAIIPHTLKITTIGQLKARDRVNVEVDILAKYVQRLLHPFQFNQRLTLGKLKDMGY